MYNICKFFFPLKFNTKAIFEQNVSHFTVCATSIYIIKIVLSFRYCAIFKPPKNRLKKIIYLLFFKKQFGFHKKKNDEKMK